MTDKQPEALRLADALGKEIVRTVHLDVLHQDALNELRRLHEVNTELVEVLKDILSWEENEEMTWYPKARAALAKATGEQQ
jgi:predicted nucleic acid-binding protein